jgi:methionine-rich copper-binding protein CopC
MRRIAAGLLLAVLALPALATPALAHVELKSSDPANGATVASAPTQLTLTFSGPIQNTGSTVTVAGPGGTQWTVGQLTAAGAVLTVPVQPTGPAGPYTVSYTVISSDGDPVKSTFAFTLATPVAPPTTTTTTTTTTSAAPPATATSQPAVAPQASSNDGTGTPGWVWILIALAVVVVVGLGGLLAVRRRRSASTSG